MFTTLRDFVDALERRGELKRISAPVSPLLEITEIAHRMARLPAPTVGMTGELSDPDHRGLGGYGLLFENIEGVESDIPVAINLFGSYHRMEMALGCDCDGDQPGGFDAIGARIRSIMKMAPPQSFGDAILKGRALLPLLRMGPKRVRRGICQEVVRTGDDVNLFRIPMIQCWPFDGNPEAVGWRVPIDQVDTAAGQGRFITLAGMYTIDAGDRDQRKPPSLNIGMYRSQLVDRNHLIMHWHIHHDGAKHWRSWKKLGKPMPIAIAFGGESVLPYSATAPLPPGMSELLMAGFLNGSPIRLTRGKTVPIDVPANAEIVIEGFVSTECGGPDFDPWVEECLGAGAALEGPFGDHTGYYSLPDRYPIVEVTAITQRRNAIYPTTVVGLPPQEDYYLGKATERIFLPMIQTILPDLIDYDLPYFGCFHNAVVIKIRKEYPHQARRVMHAVWGAGQMSWTKMVIVVDDDVDIHHLDEVLGAVFGRSYFPDDFELVTGPVDILDHAVPGHGAGHKLGIDATRMTNGEGRVEVCAGGVDVIDTELLWSKFAAICDVAFPEFGCGRCVFIGVDKKEGESARWLIEDVLGELGKMGAGNVLVYFVDGDCDLRDCERVLFLWGAACDPGRDMVVRKGEDGEAGAGGGVRGGAVGFDCTIKSPGEMVEGGGVIRRYPPILEMDSEVVKRVDGRWGSDYGLG